ncbi:ABC transporter substrate-binding protein [Thiorhodococcus mannitoliphagus]
MSVGKGFLTWLMAPLVATSIQAADPQTPVLVGLDAEFGHRTSTSAQAIQQGMEIAIAEINAAGGVLGGRPLELVTRDNGSVTARGVDDLRELAALPDMVAVFGGKFSPIYVESLPVAHELGIPLMDPWGAADIITEHDYRPSYTFRLSLKDSSAAPVMLTFAKKHYGAERVGVLLPNTAWGRGNQKAIADSAAGVGVELVGEQWYNWGNPSFLRHYLELSHRGAQALLLVGNEPEGALLVKELAGLPESERLPVVSHWGVTGGDFVKLAGDALREVRLAVVQTYSFIGRSDPIAERVLSALREGYGVAGPEFVKSPVGVAHAYDLTHLLARAVERAGSTDRAAIRDALEHLGPYQGLVRDYERPFTPERHDALSPEDVFMADYREDDQLIPVGD